MGAIKRVTFEFPVEIWEKMDEIRKETGLPLKWHIIQAFKEYFRKYKRLQKKSKEKDKALGINWDERGEIKKPQART